MSEESEKGVAIVGAGLAGLAMALALEERGVSSLLIGPPAGPGDTRTTALLQGSIKTLQTLAVWDEARALAAPLRVMSIVDATQRLVRARPVSFEASELGLDAFGWNIANADLAAILSTAVARSSRVERIAGHVAGISCRPDSVLLDVDDGRTMRARLVIAADGRESAARAAAGIDIRSWRYPQAALTANLVHSRPHRFVSTEFHGEGGPCTLVPLPGDRSSIVCVVREPEARGIAALDAEALALEFERRCQSLLGRMRIDGSWSTWPIGGLSAERMAARRVALIGEAGHAFPPIGAQGFNLTLRDVSSLAGEIEGHADPGSEEVLARYAAARRADVGMRTAAVDLMNRSLLSDFLPVQLARSAGLYALGRFGGLRRLAMREGLAPGFKP
jgi:2-octaprenyl-6-methoxyphenol hydroxylase